MQDKRWPEVGELVVCTVKKVLDFGAFVALDEYGDKEGFIHISEVASGWVKYIRNHIREGQKIVCKVFNVDPAKAHIDLSLKDVNEHQRRDKIQDWKNEQKAKKWMSFVASSTGIEHAKMNHLYDQIYSVYGSIYPGFEDAALNGYEALVESGIEEEIAIKIFEVAVENIKMPQVEISGYVDLTCPEADGIGCIKKALKAAIRVKDEKVNIEATYVGAPTYRIHVIAPDYKSAENALRAAGESAVKVIKKHGGIGEFHRHNIQKR
ncbi:MAG: translation initiation factor IF-2 subunit alpha [Halobacteriota archaeon]|nr:translation initiation factor IF-2 subunit alpha [Halobacteriota archaeon]